MMQALVYLYTLSKKSSPTTTWTSKLLTLQTKNLTPLQTSADFCSIFLQLGENHRPPGSHLDVLQACTWKPSHCYCSLWKQTTKVIQDLLKMQGILDWFCVNLLKKLPPWICWAMLPCISEKTRSVKKFGALKCTDCFFLARMFGWTSSTKKNGTFVFLVGSGGVPGFFLAHCLGLEPLADIPLYWLVNRDAYSGLL